MGVVTKVAKRGLTIDEEGKEPRNQGFEYLYTTDFEITAYGNSTERKTVSQQPKVQCC